jgi:hypothetical protein
MSARWEHKGTKDKRTRLAVLREIWYGWLWQRGTEERQPACSQGSGKGGSCSQSAIEMTSMFHSISIRVLGVRQEHLSGAVPVPDAAGWLQSVCQNRSWLGHGSFILGVSLFVPRSTKYSSDVAHRLSWDWGPSDHPFLLGPAGDY